MEAGLQLDTAKSVAARLSEPKRSVGAADKKDKKDTSAPVQGKKTAGKNTAVAGKAKQTNKNPSPKTATENSNRDLENRLNKLEITSYTSYEYKAHLMNITSYVNHILLI